MTVKIFIATDESGLTSLDVGTLTVWNGSEFVNLPVGTNGDALVADSLASEGISYKSIAGADAYLVMNSGPPNGFFGFPGDVLLSNEAGVARPLITRYLSPTTAGTFGTFVASPNAADANVALVLNPKGLGGLQAQVADGTIVGGNARGNNAVDWQTVRTAATQVASGAWSFIGGGRRNTVSDFSSVVVGGSSNTSSSHHAFVGGGESNTASASYATVAGGVINTASSSYATISGGLANTAFGTWTGTVAGGSNNVANSGTIGGGNNNTVSGNFSIISGGRYGLANQYGMFSHASGQFAATGDAQYSRMILRRQTTDATPSILTADGGAGSTSTRVILANNTGYQFLVQVMARDTSGTDSAWWTIRGGIIKDTSVGSTTLIGTNIIETSSTPGAATWIVTATADTTNGALAITVTGALGVTIRWVATIHLNTVRY
jgi:hypothetical protein